MKQNTIVRKSGRGLGVGERWKNGKKSTALKKTLTGLRPIRATSELIARNEVNDVGEDEKR